MNKFQIIGRLTKDVELTKTPSDISVGKVSVAVNRKKYKKDEEPIADFFNCTLWRGLAETCAKYLHKGDQVYFCGELQTHTYEDKDGVKRTAYDLVVDEAEFIGTKKKDGETDEESPKKSTPARMKTSASEMKQMELDDDLPF